MAFERCGSCQRDIRSYLIEERADGRYCPSGHKISGVTSRGNNRGQVKKGGRFRTHDEGFPAAQFQKRVVPARIVLGRMNR